MWLAIVFSLVFSVHLHPVLPTQFAHGECFVFVGRSVQFNASIWMDPLYYVGCIHSHLVNEIPFTVYRIWFTHWIELVTKHREKVLLFFICLKCIEYGRTLCRLWRLSLLCVCNASYFNILSKINMNSFDKPYSVRYTTCESKQSPSVITLAVFTSRKRRVSQHVVFYFRSEWNLRWKKQLRVPQTPPMDEQYVLGSHLFTRIRMFRVATATTNVYACMVFLLPPFFYIE